MADQEKKGDDWAHQADKRLKGWSWGSDQKQYDVVEYLEKAGNCYKIAKAWEKGGALFQQLADFQGKNKDSQHEVAAALIEAANCYKKISPSEATRCLEKAVDLYSEAGRLNMAARYCKELAELYEKGDNLEAAMKWFEKAADFYGSESAATSANQMRLKVAEFAALDNQYLRAIDIYETVARESMDSNLLKYSAKNYLLNAGICFLCLKDEVAMQNALDKYQDLDPGFGDSREFKLLSNLMAAVEEGDPEVFTDHIKEFDSLSRLDAWKTSLLLRAKKAMAEEEEELV